MDILLIGGKSQMMDLFIDKLNKEGHRVYVLTGSRDQFAKNKKVFEYYFFSYESKSLKEVFFSVSPNVVLCFGAYDTNFFWDNEREESIRYSAGMLSILMAYASYGKGKFIYLSSEEVYENACEEIILPEKEPEVSSFKAMTMVQLEKVCESYREQRELNVVVVRLDHLCELPKTPAHVTSTCVKMCIKALKTGEVSVNKKHEFSLLYVSDAIEYLYQFLLLPKYKKTYYQLSSKEVIDEEILAKLIKKKQKGSLLIHKNDSKNKKRVVLANNTESDEMDVKIFYHAEDIIDFVVDYLLKNKRIFLGDENTKFFGMVLKDRVKEYVKIFVPYLENLILFIPFFMLNNRAVGSDYFSKIDFYLIYVLLFAVVHGQKQAIVSSVLATIGFLFRQSYDKSGFEVLIDYNTYVWIAEIFIVGMTVGNLRDQLLFLKKESKQEEGYLKEQLSDVEEINTSNMEMKTLLINQLIGQSDSVGYIYGITSKLDQCEAEEVLFYAAKVLADIMKSKDVCIYIVANNDFARLYSYTSKKSQQMGNSIEYRNCGEMSEAFEKREVYVNRKLEDGYPLMAQAVYVEEQIKIILMVWEVPWKNLTLSEVNILSITSRLIRDAVERGDRYLDALERDRYVSGTAVLETEAFTNLTRAFVQAKEQHLTECSLIRVRGEKSLEEMAKDIKGKLRTTDYMGTLKDGNFYVLLANTDNQIAENVAERLKEMEYHCTVVTVKLRKA